MRIQANPPDDDVISIQDVLPDDTPDPSDEDRELLDLLQSALKLSDVAERLNVSPRHVQELVDKGELIASDIGLGDVRQRLRVTEADLQGYLLRKRVRARKVSAFVEARDARPKPLPANPTFAERRASRKARQAL